MVAVIPTEIVPRPKSGHRADRFVESDEEVRVVVSVVPFETVVHSSVEAEIAPRLVVLAQDTVETHRLDRVPVDTTDIEVLPLGIESDRDCGNEFGFFDDPH